LAKARTRRGGRSAFRAEFYQDLSAAKKPASKSTGVAARKRRRRKASIVLPVFGLFFLLCVIAVMGSSAMIWLRKLGAVFGVEWMGDG
jgi:hypothetical protein